MEMKSRQTVAGTLLFLAGSTIGAGLAALLAPQSGKKTRRQIAQYGSKMRTDAEEMATRTAHSVSDMVESIGDKTGHMLGRGEEVATDLRKRFRRSQH